MYVLQTSSETFFRTSKFYKAGDEAPPVFIVDGVSYLSIKVGLQDCSVLCTCWARLHAAWALLHRFKSSSSSSMAGQHHKEMPRVSATMEHLCKMHNSASQVLHTLLIWRLTGSKVPDAAGVLVKGLERQVAKAQVVVGKGLAPAGPMCQQLPSADSPGRQVYSPHSKPYVRLC